MTTDAKAVAGHTCMVGGAKAGSGAKKADGAKAADGAKNPDGFKAGDGAWGAWGDNSTADDANCKAKGGAMEPYLCSAIQTLTNDKLTPTWASLAGYTCARRPSPRAQPPYFALDVALL